jgi:hypothetical protein
MKITIPEKGEIALTNINEPKFESDLPTGIGKPAKRALAGAGYLRLEQFTMIQRGRGSEVAWFGTKTRLI